MTSLTNLIFHKPYVVTKSGSTLTVPISEPWYRTLPVSCITDLEISIDGKQIDKSKITLEIDGVQRKIEDCAAAHDAYWFVQDQMFVHIEGIEVGESAEISGHLVTRIPYIMVGPTTALPHHAIQSEIFKVVSK